MRINRHIVASVLLLILPTSCTAIAHAAELSLEKAIADGGNVVRLSAGTYSAGPTAIALKPGTHIQGISGATVIKPVKGTGVVLIMGADNELSGLTVQGNDMLTGGVADGAIRLPREADRCSISNVRFMDCDRACIVTDHAHELRVENCRFQNVGLAISTQFSNRIWIMNNYLDKCRLHGIQFWGNWEFSNKDSRDIVISGNQVKDGGGGAIWGTGAVRVAVTGNIVDGADDVGIDLEWCDDATITGNVVRNCENAGISLFMSCHRVTISGNTVLNDRAYKTPPGDWWVRSGIWLTSPNKKAFKEDNGHRDINITGNTIWCDLGAGKRAMWIGDDSLNIRITGNLITGGDIWSGEGEIKKIGLDSFLK